LIVVDPRLGSAAAAAIAQAVAQTGSREEAADTWLPCPCLALVYLLRLRSSSSSSRLLHSYTQQS